MSESSHADTEIKGYALGESVDITVINKFYDELKSLLSDNRAVCIDAKDVKRIDTSALQLLCSWIQEAKNKNIKVSWKNIDGVFYQSAKLLGVSEHLALE
jgi:ABC-type transporter Mla MlaB component